MVCNKSNLGWFSVTNLNVPNPYLLTFLNGSPCISLFELQSNIHSVCFFSSLSIQKPGLQPLSFTSMCHSFPWGPYAKYPNQISAMYWEERDHNQSWMLTLPHGSDHLHRSVCPKSGKSLLSLPIGCQSYPLKFWTSSGAHVHIPMGSFRPRQALVFNNTGWSDRNGEGEGKN